MRSVHSSYRAIIPTVVLVPVIVAAQRPADPLQALIPVAAAWLAGVGLAVAGVEYVRRSRSHPEGSLPGPRPNTYLSGFGPRVVAFATDWIALMFVELLLFSVLNPRLGAAAPWVASVVFPVYFVGCWGATGQTMGMKVAGLSVVRSSDGGRLSWSGAVLRFVGLVVALAPLYAGVIWAAFDERKRGWHDMIAGTVVIQTHFATDPRAAAV